MSRDVEHDARENWHPPVVEQRMRPAHSFILIIVIMLLSLQQTIMQIISGTYANHLIQWLFQM
jgi:hypothetical protein